jgi:hypothetical protein
LRRSWIFPNAIICQPLLLDPVSDIPDRNAGAGKQGQGNDAKADRQPGDRPSAPNAFLASETCVVFSVTMAMVPAPPNSRPAQAFARSVKEIVSEPCARRSAVDALARSSAISGGRALASALRSSSSIAGVSGRPFLLRNASEAECF